MVMVLTTPQTFLKNTWHNVKYAAFKIMSNNVAQTFILDPYSWQRQRTGT